MLTSTEDLLDPFVTSSLAGYDGLRLLAVPLVPEIQLYLADDAFVLQARMEAMSGQRIATPLWADAWAGGQAVARYVLDRPEIVAGKKVLDVASGSGLVAVAAALAGAARVVANDIDEYSLAAIALNAQANDVAIDVSGGDLLDGDGGDAEIVLAGDVFYKSALAERMLAFLQRVTARGASVLVGDPQRGHLPEHWLTPVASYPVKALGAPEDSQITRVQVLQPAG